MRPAVLTGPIEALRTILLKELEVLPDGARGQAFLEEGNFAIFGLPPNSYSLQSGITVTHCRWINLSETVAYGLSEEILKEATDKKS